MQNFKKEKIAIINNKTLVIAKKMNSLSITPNGKTILGLTYDGYLYIWNTLLGELETVLNIEEENKNLYKDYFKCSKMVLSCCGSFVILLNKSFKHQYIVIDLEKKSVKCLSTTISGVRQDMPEINCSLRMTISRNNDFFLFNFKDSIVQIFFTKNKKVSCANLKGDTISSFAINSKNYYFVIGSIEGNIFLYSFQPNKEVWKISEAHSQKIVDLCFTNDTQYIISAGEEGNVKVWDFHTGKHLYNLYDSIGKIRALQLSDNGLFLVITLERKVLILNLETKEEKEIKKPTQHLHYPMITALNNDQLVINSLSDGLQVYDIQTATLRKNFSNLLHSHNSLKGLDLGCGENSSISLEPLEISADSNYVVSTFNFQQIVLWNIGEKRLERVFIEDEKAIGKVTISPNNEYVIASTINLFEESDFIINIDIYDVESSLKIANFTIENRYCNVVLLRVTLDSKYLILILSGATFIRFDLDNLKEIENKKISCPEYDTFSHTISLDGSLTVFGMKKNCMNTLETIEIYDNVKGQRQKNIEYFIKEGSYFFSIVISKDNRYIKLYANNKKLFCWDRDRECFLYRVVISDIDRLDSFSNIIINSKIAPNKRYAINRYYKQDNKGLSLWDLEQMCETHRLMIFEKEESLFMDVNSREL